MLKKQTLAPDPSRLIEGLRDTGYNFNTACCDIIDNSIDAKSSNIAVRIDMDVDGEIFVSIADNGSGMSEDELLNAMTYGATSNKGANALGKFGLGLKTASTAFSRRLSVISRNEKGGTTRKAIWDLDHVSNVRAWEVLLDDPTDEEMALLDETAEGGPGTLVVWEKIDRLLRDYKKPGKAKRTALQKLNQQFADYATMVFQRFLDPEFKDCQNITMSLNGNPLAPWDPFCRKIDKIEVVASKTQNVAMDDGKQANFFVKATVLPRREEFPSPLDAKAARLSTHMQGVYVYRENRLIHGHDWLGLFNIEPHLSLLRVEFSFDHTLDDAFYVDLKKSRILLKDELFLWLKNQFLQGPRRAAEDRYRKGEKKKILEMAEKSAHSSSNASISAKEEELKLADVKVLDASKGEVQLTNRKGVFRVIMPVFSAMEKGAVHIQPVAGIDDGLLWEPCIIDEHHGVKINTGHAYYHKVYVPNLKSGVTVQGMDSLLWALGEAELGATTDSTRRHFMELRFEISRLLRGLVEDLPDPDTSENDEIDNEEADV